MQKVRHLFQKKKKKKRPNKTDQKIMTTNDYIKKFIPPPPPPQKEDDSEIEDSEIEVIDIPLNSPKQKILVKVQEEPITTKPVATTSAIVYEEKYTRIGRKIMRVRVQIKEPEHLSYLN